MSILKESIQSAMSSKAFKWLILLIVLFLGVVSYFFTYVISYTEKSVSTDTISLHVMAVKTNKDSHKVFYKINDTDDLYFLDIKKCELKPKLAGSVISANKIHYEYNSTFTSGSSSRIESPETLFCVKV